MDGGGSTDTWYTDSSDDPGGCASPNPRDPAGGMWAAVDSDCAGEVAMDEALITPLLDLSLAATVTLAFDHYFNRDAGEIAAVDVRSSLTGGVWINMATWLADTANPVHESLDLSGVAAGAADVEIRWHYHGAQFAWYWYLDNVRVTFAAPGGCRLTPCPTGSPPGEQTGVAWPDTGTMSWDGDPAASSGCRIHRGRIGELGLLAGAGIDSCLRLSTESAGGSSADLTSDLPLAGSSYWYLVTGCNEVGEGTAGTGTASFRIINSSGDCPE